MNKISIVVPIYILSPDLFSMTKKCIEDLEHKTFGVEKEIIVVDDGSPNQKLVSLLKNKFFPNINWLHNPKNKGFAHTVNLGISHATSDYILLLNNDVRIDNGNWLSIMFKILQHYNWDLTAPKEGVLNENLDYVPYAHRNKNTVITHRYLQGWCLLMKRKVMEQVGLMPTCFGRGFWEDCLWGNCVSLAGFKAGVAQNIPLSHKEHTTFKECKINITDQYKKNKKLYVEIIRGKQKIKLPTIEDYRKNR